MPKPDIKLTLPMQTIKRGISKAAPDNEQPTRPRPSVATREQAVGELSRKMDALLEEARQMVADNRIDSFHYSLFERHFECAKRCITTMAYSEG